MSPFHAGIRECHDARSERSAGWGTVDAVFCTNCGHKNPEGVNFCSSCGHALLADGDDATITLHPTEEAETSEDQPDVTWVEVPHGAGVLVVTRGPNVGARYLLGEQVVKAGRHPESDIFLDDITVSRRHVEITPTGDGCLLPAGRRLAERDLREPRAHRGGRARPGRRGADRQVQARLPGGGERVSSRSYLSIGDVLTLLREEFPDVTISKIRFLESQGLVNPERSPSGYRKFFDHDVERLRWVLRQQREHFLPLKVIRDRLADGDLDDTVGEPPNGKRQSREQPTPAPRCSDRRRRVRRAGHVVHRPTSEEPTKADEEAMARILADATRRAAPPARGRARTGAASRSSATPACPLRPPRAWPARRRKAAATTAASVASGTGTGTGTATWQSPTPRPGVRGGPPRSRRVPVHAGPVARRRAHRVTPATGPAAGERRRRCLAIGLRAASAAPGPRQAGGKPGKATDTPGPTAYPALRRPRGPSGVAMVTGASLTAEELCAASGLSVEEVAGLVSFGLIEPVVVAGIQTYDEDALTLANLAASFRAYGIEPRHLRQYRNAVDREVGLIEQVVIPLLRQRNPESRQKALDAADELGALGQTHASHVAQAGPSPPSGGVTQGRDPALHFCHGPCATPCGQSGPAVEHPGAPAAGDRGRGPNAADLHRKPEATAIAYALQGVTMPRPLTHDLMKDMLGALDINVERVIITELRASTYFAELHLVRGEERTIVSSRPSDAVADRGAHRDAALRLRRADGVRGDHPDARGRGRRRGHARRAGRPVPPVPRLGAARGLRGVTRPRWALALVACAALGLAACGEFANTPKKTTTATTHQSTVDQPRRRPRRARAHRSTTLEQPGVVGLHPRHGVPGPGPGRGGHDHGQRDRHQHRRRRRAPRTATRRIALFSGSGAPITITMVNGLSVDVSTAANAAPSTVTLAPSGTAQFAYQFSDVPVGNETSCPTSESGHGHDAGLDGRRLRPSRCQLDPCGNGTIRVSPIYAS